MARTKFLKFDGFVADHWSQWVGEEVAVRFRRDNSRRWRLKQGRLFIFRYPFGCECCAFTVAVLASAAGEVKWSSAPSTISVGSEVALYQRLDEGVNRILQQESEHI